MAYELNAEGSNGVNGTTSISNLGGFDFGVLLQLDGEPKAPPLLQAEMQALSGFVLNICRTAHCLPHQHFLRFKHAELEFLESVMPPPSRSLCRLRTTPRPIS